MTLKFQAILNDKENIFRKLNFKIPKIDRGQKYQQIFSQKVNKFSSEVDNNVNKMTMITDKAPFSQSEPQGPR